MSALVCDFSAANPYLINVEFWIQQMHVSETLFATWKPTFTKALLFEWECMRYRIDQNRDESEIDKLKYYKSFHRRPRRLWKSI